MEGRRVSGLHLAPSIFPPRPRGPRRGARHGLFPAGSRVSSPQPRPGWKIMKIPKNRPAAAQKRGKTRHPSQKPCHPTPKTDRQTPIVDQQTPIVDRQTPIVDRQTLIVDRQTLIVDRKTPNVYRQTPAGSPSRSASGHRGARTSAWRRAVSTRVSDPGRPDAGQRSPCIVTQNCRAGAASPAAPPSAPAKAQLSSGLPGRSRGGAGGPRTRRARPARRRTRLPRPAPRRNTPPVNRTFQLILGQRVWLNQYCSATT
jgi:hypothetical protein